MWVVVGEEGCEFEVVGREDINKSARSLECCAVLWDARCRERFPDYERPGQSSAILVAEPQERGDLRDDFVWGAKEVKRACVQELRANKVFRVRAKRGRCVCERFGTESGVSVLEKAARGRAVQRSADDEVLHVPAGYFLSCRGWKIVPC